MNQLVSLILFKALAELRIEASRNYLGWFWWIADPVAYMLAFYFVFAVGFRMGGEDFVPFLLIGTTTWRWFNGGVQGCAGSVARSAGLMNQVYFPKWILLASSAVSSTLKFLFILAALLTFLLLAGYSPDVHWLGILPVMLVQVALILGVGGICAAVVPFFPDLRLFIDNGLLILFFMSGVFYDITERPENVQQILFFNPMAGMITSYRNLLIDGMWPDWAYLAVVAVFAIIGVAVSLKILDANDRVYPKVVN